MNNLLMFLNMFGSYIFFYWILFLILASTNDSSESKKENDSSTILLILDFDFSYKFFIYTSDINEKCTKFHFYVELFISPNNNF